MLAEAVHGCFYAGDTPAMIVGRRARRRAGRPERVPPRATFFAAMAQGMALVADGQGEAGAASARQAVEILEESDELRDDPGLLAWAALGPLWLREAEAGRGLIDRAFEQARAQAALGALPFLLHLLARDQATTDQWAAAEASYDEAIRLGARPASESSSPRRWPGSPGWKHGRGARARAANMPPRRRCARSSASASTASGRSRPSATSSSGSAGPPRRSSTTEAQAEALRSRGIADVDLSPAPELVDAFLRLGRDDDAAAVAADFVAQATAKGQPWALARAARCRGLLADAGRAGGLLRGSAADCTHGHRTCSRPPAPGWPTGRACAVPANAFGHASSCARRSRSSSASARSPGPTRRAQSWRPRARRPGVAT